jgi:23S rRNA (cytosine1962-C5)-methyltransferase
VDKNLFASTVMSAAIESKRKVKIARYLNQPCDHPVNIFHPEGEYLKGLLLYVD